MPTEECTISMDIYSYYCKLEALRVKAWNRWTVGKGTRARLKRLDRACITVGDMLDLENKRDFMNLDYDTTLRIIRKEWRRKYGSSTLTDVKKKLYG